MNKFTIYMITNDVNDKVYIGQTAREVQERFNEHCNCNLSPIGRAIQTIGKEHFTVSVLDDTSTNPEELAKKEDFYISKYQAIENGYNSKPASKARYLAPEKLSVLVNMDKELKAKLEQLARDDGRSLTNLINKILTDYVEGTQK